eukprot:ctg_1118.g340
MSTEHSAPLHRRCSRSFVALPRHPPHDRATGSVGGRSVCPESPPPVVDASRGGPTRVRYFGAKWLADCAGWCADERGVACWCTMNWDFSSGRSTEARDELLSGSLTEGSGRVEAGARSATSKLDVSDIRAAVCEVQQEAGGMAEATAEVEALAVPTSWVGWGAALDAGARRIAVGGVRHGPVHADLVGSGGQSRLRVSPGARRRAAPRAPAGGVRICCRRHRDGLRGDPNWSAVSVARFLFERPQAVRGECPEGVFCAASGRRPDALCGGGPLGRVLFGRWRGGPHGFARCQGRSIRQRATRPGAAHSRAVRTTGVQGGLRRVSHRGDHVDRLVFHLWRQSAWPAGQLAGYRQCHLGGAATRIPLAIADDVYVDVACGDNHTLLLTASGRVVSFGLGARGQLGHGSTGDAATPKLVRGQLEDRRVVAIAAAGDHSLALCEDGSVFAWGSGEVGQRGDDDVADKLLPSPVRLPSSLSAGAFLAPGSERQLAEAPMNSGSDAPTHMVPVTCVALHTTPVASFAILRPAGNETVTRTAEPVSGIYALLQMGSPVPSIDLEAVEAYYASSPLPKAALYMLAREQLYGAILAMGDMRMCSGSAAIPDCQSPRCGGARHVRPRPDRPTLSRGGAVAAGRHPEPHFRLLGGAEPVAGPAVAAADPAAALHAGRSGAGGGVAAPGPVRSGRAIPAERGGQGSHLSRRVAHAAALGARTHPVAARIPHRIRDGGRHHRVGGVSEDCGAPRPHRRRRHGAAEPDRVPRTVAADAGVLCGRAGRGRGRSGQGVYDVADGGTAVAELRHVHRGRRHALRVAECGRARYGGGVQTGGQGGGTGHPERHPHGRAAAAGDVQETARPAGHPGRSAGDVPAAGAVAAAPAGVRRAGGAVRGVRGDVRGRLRALRRARHARPGARRASYRSDPGEPPRIRRGTRALFVRRVPQPAAVRTRRAGGAAARRAGTGLSGARAGDQIRRRLHRRQPCRALVLVHRAGQHERRRSTATAHVCERQRPLAGGRARTPAVPHPARRARHRPPAHLPHLFQRATAAGLC